MTDGIELRMKYIGIIEGLQAIFGPWIEGDPVVHGIPRGYSHGGPPPVPWRQGAAQRMGVALVRAAQMKVAAKMAGNDALAGAADGRIMAFLDGDWCPTYPHVIKLPPLPPAGPDPDPRPDEMAVNWQGFEVMLGTVMDYQVALPDGALKDELDAIVKQIAAPG